MEQSNLDTHILYLLIIQLIFDIDYHNSMND